MAFLDFEKKSFPAIIFLVALCCFVPFLGLSHLFDWDEINFAEAAREMLVTGEYSYVQINYKPFWEKPPLFIWMQVISMKLFGINEFAARLPNAICGAATLTVLFQIGKILRSARFGLLWVLVYAGSILPQFYFRSGIIDPWFNLFIFLGVYQLIKASSGDKINRRNLFYSAVFISLAVITKGPTALGIVGISCAIYFLLNYKTHSWKIADPIIYVSLVLALGFSWFLLEILQGRGHIIKEFIDYHIRLFAESEAGHGQPFYYHPIVLLIGCFPMSLFFIYSWFNKSQLTPKEQHFKQWMSILFWVVLIVFSIVKTKIVHYSSLTYFPMSFLAAISIHQLLKGKWSFKPKHQLPLLLFIAVLGSAFVLLGMLDSIKEPLLRLLQNDKLAYGNFSQSVPDQWFEPLIGLSFMFIAMGSVFLILMGKKKPGIIGLFGSTFFTVWFLAMFAAPKIDRYTQDSLFDFYRENAGKAYLHPMHRSYAHFFYGSREKWDFVPEDELKWLIYEEIDKPAYFITRAQDVEKAYYYFPFLQEKERRGGYVILERNDKNYPFSGAE